MTRSRKPMGSEQVPQKLGVYQVLKTRLFSCPLHSGNGRINTPSAGTQKHPPRSRGNLSVWNLFATSSFISFSRDLEQDWEGRLWFHSSSVPGLVSTVAPSGATRTKVTLSMGLHHIPRACASRPGLIMWLGPDRQALPVHFQLLGLSLLLLPCPCLPQFPVRYNSAISSLQSFP